MCVRVSVHAIILCKGHLYKSRCVSVCLCMPLYYVRGISICQDVCPCVCACQPTMWGGRLYKSRCLCVCVCLCTSSYTWQGASVSVNQDVCVCVCACYAVPCRGGLSLQIEMSVCESETNWRFIKMCWNLKGNNGAPLGAVIWTRYLYL